MNGDLTVLGIESSCDDTAAAVVRLSAGQPEVLSSEVHGQADLHALYGGVVPEIAARAHVEKLDAVTQRALSEAGVCLSKLDAIAVTAGPGLIGGVVAGAMFARGLAAGAGCPILPVNHLAGHALTPRFTDDARFPYLLLLVSGGHCQFLLVEGPSSFHRLGGTIDDAPGEAFDKAARLLGLSQPGGPAIEACAADGDPSAYRFPRPLLDRPGCDLSFSGLKTALLRARDAAVAAEGGLTSAARANLAAAFQSAVVDVLAGKTRRALDEALGLRSDLTALAVAGGVAANAPLREALREVAGTLPCITPPQRFCTDNAAMIAWAGIEALQNGVSGSAEFSVRPRWPLDTRSAPLLGSGRKGAKA